MNREQLRELVTREVALRFLASLALALILWALVTIREDPETNRAFADVPVQPTSLDNSLIILNPLNPVRVTLSGPRSDVNPIDGDDLVATIDFSNVSEPGVYDLPISLNLPRGVWDSNVTPGSATVEVERSVSGPFPLMPVVSDLDENSLRTVTVYPEVERVTATGPTSLIDSIAQVVLPVEVSGGTQTFEGTYVPEAHDRDGNLIEGVVFDPASVEATVRVSARGKSVAVLAAITGSPAAGYEVAERTINPQFVIVDGDEAALDALVALTTEPIDVSGASESFNRTVQIADLPEGLQILQPSSGQVEVLVQITQRGVRQSLPSQQVTIIGVGDGLSASVTPDEITIDVAGPEETLAELDSTNLQVIVDATGLAPGTYTVKPSVIMPPRVQWVTTVPTEVTLTISEVASEASPEASTTEATPEAEGTP